MFMLPSQSYEDSFNKRATSTTTTTITTIIIIITIIVAKPTFLR